jgi:hypothetical protein
MSAQRLAIEPHNCPRINDRDGERYLPIPPQSRSDAVTIKTVSTKSRAVHEP